MSADRLREAAAVLRARVEEIEPSAGWSFNDGGARDDGTRPADSALIEFITMMSPPVALALADWLDGMARSVHGTSKGDVPHEDAAIHVADAILGADR